MPMHLEKKKCAVALPLCFLFLQLCRHTAQDQREPITTIASIISTLPTSSSVYGSISNLNPRDSFFLFSTKITTVHVFRNFVVLVSHSLGSISRDDGGGDGALSCICLTHISTSIISSIFHLLTDDGRRHEHEHAVVAETAIIVQRT